MRTDQDRAAALLQQGRSELERADHHSASVSFASAARLAQMLGDQELELTALNMQAQAVHALGQPQNALNILERGLKRLAADAPPERIARVRSNIGELQRKLGNLSAALEQLLAAQELFEAEQVQGRPMAVNLINMGLLYQDLGRHHEAGGFLQRAFQAGLDLKDDRLVAVALNNLANGDLSTGDLFVARERFETALSYARQLGMTDYIIDNLDGLGQTLAGLGDFGQALQVHQQVLELARSGGNRSGELDALINLGRDHLYLNSAERALQPLQEALSLASALLTPSRQFEVHLLLSEAYEAAGNPWEALSHSRQSLELQETVSAERNRERLRELKVKHQLARVQQEADSYRLRAELLRQSNREAENRVRQRTEQLELAHLDALERLALAAEYRDDATGAHTRRVGRNAAVIAFVLGFELADSRDLYTAAKLHDVGKIAVPDALLHKAGRLNDEELQVIRQHTVIGARLLTGSESRLLQLAGQICLYHHERFDGSGYPERLAGADIPLAARIVTVADVLDALTHERPYKPAWPLEQALAELRAQSGRQFDPLIVEVCLSAFAPGTGVDPTAAVAAWPDVQQACEQLQHLRRTPAPGPLFTQLVPSVQ